MNAAKEIEMAYDRAPTPSGGTDWVGHRSSLAPRGSLLAWPDLDLDRDLDRVGAGPEPALIPFSAAPSQPSLLIDERDLARACAAAAARARAEALADARTARDTEDAALQERLHRRLLEHADAYRAEAAGRERELCAAALAVVRSLLTRATPALLAELEASARALVADVATPTGGLRIFVAPERVAWLQERVESFGTASISGEVTVEAAPDLGPLDVRVVARDAWAERVIARAMRQIEEGLGTAAHPSVPSGDDEHDLSTDGAAA